MAKVPFEEFVKEHPPFRGRRCWVGTIPEREEIEALYEEGHGQTLISAWLVANGYPRQVATISRLNYHLRKECSCG